MEEIIASCQNLENWLTISDLVKKYPQFTPKQLNKYIKEHQSKKHFQHCYKRFGKKIYINEKLFGLYLGGLLRIH